MYAVSHNVFPQYITIPAGYEVHSVQLIEVSNEFKPSLGEVRVEYNYEHTHKYVDGVCKCGSENNDYVSILDEFATMLVSDFNKAGGNSTTTIENFSTTSNANMKKTWVNSTRLYKYQWFFYFIKEEMTAVAKANNMLDDSNYLSAIDLLNEMILSANATTIFTREDHSIAVEILCYYIHALINKTKLNTFTVPSKYSKFMVDYSDDTNRARFLNAYEKSKYTIKIIAYNNSSALSGGYSNQALINVWYIADESILSENSLRYQNKILLKHVEDDIYEVIATSGKNTSAEDNIAKTMQGQWDYVIATASEADYEDFLESIDGKFIRINNEDMVIETSGYSGVYNQITSFTYDKGFEVEILDSMPSTPPVHSEVLIVDPSGDGDYVTLADAIAAAKEGDTIYISSGTYDTQVTIDKAITLVGANAGVNPVTQERKEETVFENDITIAADGVVIDGIALSGDGRIVGSNTSIEDITIKNVVSTESNANIDGANGKNAPIYFYTSSSGVEYTNIVIDQVKYEGSKGRPMVFYGDHINGLTITNSYFKSGETNVYNDAIKIDDTSNVYGIKGDVVIKNNYFENYGQYTIWFDDYSEGNYSIVNNTFVNCGFKIYEGAYDTINAFTSYRGATNGIVTIKSMYNVMYGCGPLIRLTKNASRTSSNLIVHINYNKFYNVVSTYYIENRNTFTIDATYNYYDVTPTASLFYNSGQYTTWSPYYTDEKDVPLYPGD